MPPNVRKNLSVTKDWAGQSVNDTKLTNSDTGNDNSRQNASIEEQQNIADRQDSRITSGFDVRAAVQVLNKRAKPKYTGYCAVYVRTAMEAGGLKTTGHPVPAKDYISYLPKLGFKGISKTDYEPLMGDIVVFEKIPKHEYGHIQMYNGNQWVSDFYQNGFYPSLDYLQHKAAFSIWRW